MGTISFAFAKKGNYFNTFSCSLHYALLKYFKYFLVPGSKGILSILLSEKTVNTGNISGMLLC